MMRRLFLILLLVWLAACAVESDRDGGIGGTGAPVAQAQAV